MSRCVTAIVSATAAALDDRALAARRATRGLGETMQELCLMLCQALPGSVTAAHEFAAYCRGMAEQGTSGHL